MLPITTPLNQKGVIISEIHSYTNRNLSLLQNPGTYRSRAPERYEHANLFIGAYSLIAYKSGRKGIMPTLHNSKVCNSSVVENKTDREMTDAEP